MSEIWINWQKHLGRPILGNLVLTRLNRLVSCWVAALCLATMRPLKSLWLHGYSKSDYTFLSLLWHSMQSWLVSFWDQSKIFTWFPMYWVYPNFNICVIWVSVVCCVLQNKLDSLGWIWSLEIPILVLRNCLATKNYDIVNLLNCVFHHDYCPIYLDVHIILKRMTWCSHYNWKVYLQSHGFRKIASSGTFTLRRLFDNFDDLLIWQLFY
jgi:hypothetical protein